MLYYNITIIINKTYTHITFNFGTLMSQAFNINKLKEPYYAPISSFNFSVKHATVIFSVTAALGMASLPVMAEETKSVDIELTTSADNVVSSMKMPSTTLDTIVVTSNPLLPQTNEMATATSIITGDTLDSQVNSTLGDALENEIGVSTDSFGQGASRPIIRGQSAPRVQVMQNGLTVQDAS